MKNNGEVIYTTLNSYEETILKKASSNSQSLPNVLYHYTTAKGIIGIIESGHLWATHNNFFSDPTEMQYGLDLVDEELNNILENEKKTESNNIITNALSQFKDYYEKENLVPPYDIYIVSFSEERDMLSQWRGYGNDGKGFMIGFDFSKIENLSCGLPIDIGVQRTPKINLIKVEYNKDTQKKIARESFKKLITKIKEINSKNNVSEEIVKKHVLGLRSQLMFLFKNSSFEEEQEWRCIQARKILELDGIKYRCSNDNIIPYVELEFSIVSNEGKNLIPMDEILFGPKQDKRKANITFSIILISQGYVKRDIKIPDLNKSEIPYI